MSGNASPRALRSAILSSRLADLATYELEVDCGTPSCRRDRRYRISDLAGLFGKEMLVSEMIRRLRCQECGERVNTVALVQTVGIRRPVLVRTVLIGSKK